MRMNTNRIVHDEEDEEYIRRPMSSLMTSSTTMASSNISMISSSDVSSSHTNEKQNKNKNQSLPKAQDFPALSSTNATSNSSRNVTIDVSTLILIKPFSSIWCLDSRWKYFIGKIICNTTEEEVQYYE